MPNIQFKLKTKYAEVDFRGDNLTNKQADTVLREIISPNFSRIQHVKNVVNNIIQGDSAEKYKRKKKRKNKK